MYFDGVPMYVISLPDDWLRRQNVIIEYGRLGFEFEFFEAVDFRNLPPELVRQIRAGTQRSSLRTALVRYATIESHRAVMALIVQRGHTRAWVFEDDVRFLDDIRQYCNVLLPDDWRVLYINGRYAGRKEQVNQHLYRAARFYGTAGYMVNAKSAQELLAVFEYKTGADAADTVWHSWQAETPGHYFFYPFPTDEFVFRSHVRNRSQQAMGSFRQSIFYQMQVRNTYLRMAEWKNFGEKSGESPDI